MGQTRYFALLLIDLFFRLSRVLSYTPSPLQHSSVQQIRLLLLFFHGNFPRASVFDAYFPPGLEDHDTLFGPIGSFFPVPCPPNLAVYPPRPKYLVPRSPPVRTVYFLLCVFLLFPRFLLSVPVTSKKRFSVTPPSQRFAVVSWFKRPLFISRCIA